MSGREGISLKSRQTDREAIEGGLLPARVTGELDELALRDWAQTLVGRRGRKACSSPVMAGC